MAQRIRAEASKRSRRAARVGGTIRTVTILGVSLCLVACLLPSWSQVEAGRLQDFIQNLVGGGNSNSNSNSNSEKSNSNSNPDSNSNNNNNNDADSAASGDSNEQAQMTPMMSAMSPFMRYPSFYDSFGPAGYGAAAFSPMSAFSSPMGAMSSLSPMAMLSGQSFGGAYSPASFAPASFGSFGQSAANPMSSFSNNNGMSASQLSNVYATAAGTPNMMAGYTPYYGRRR